MDIVNMKVIKEKRPSGRPPLYTQEFMMMVARKVVDEGVRYREASRMFGISHGSIGVWVKEYRAVKRGKKSCTYNPSPEMRICRLESQVKDLKGEIGDLYLENLFLKKALNHSTDARKGDSSIITSDNLDQSKGAAKL